MSDNDEKKQRPRAKGLNGEFQRDFFRGMDQLGKRKVSKEELDTVSPILRKFFIAFINEATGDSR